MVLADCFYRVSVKALVLDADKRFLLCRRSDGLWELPGGGLNFGESPATGLIREIYEELNVVATLSESQPSYFLTTQDENKLWYANVIYITTLDGLDFTVSDECRELKFFSKKEAMMVTINSNVRLFIDAFDPMNH